MKNICDYSYCSACSACINICPKHCISFVENNIGHKVPKIEFSECLDCGACENVCQVNNPVKLETPLSVVAAYAINKEEHVSSSSGGIASVISRNIIMNGGIVYGSAFEPPLIIKHVRITNEKELYRLKGSKYVQSDLTDVYRLVKIDLNSKKQVLFIGTPCQVGGLKNFLKTEKENLFTIDLICHGVPSIRSLKDSIPLNITSKYKDWEDISFREGAEYHFSLKGKMTFYSRPLWKDLYLKAFFTALTYRDSCFKCRYAKHKRVGDITLGDFWGLKDYNFEKKAKDGVSLVLINTEKGQNLIDNICNNPLAELKR